MLPKALLLDLDGTLLDDHASASNAIRDLHAARGGRMGGGTAEEAVERWWQALSRHFIRYERGEISFQGQRRDRIRALFRRPDLSDPEADDLFQEYVELSAARYVLFDDVLPFLGRVKARGIPMAIVTNGHPDVQLRKVKATGLDTWMRGVIVSEAVGYRKPQQEIFLMAAEAVGVEPAHCLMVGDRHDADYLGAQGAGMEAVLLEGKDRSFFARAFA